MPLPHWDYFLAIEADLANCARYVDFDERNFSAYSIEFAQIILRAGAEAEITCAAITATDTGKWTKIRNDFPAAANRKIGLSRYDLTIVPWNEWNSTNEAPAWFQAYNDIKHNRLDREESANLKNALWAVAGLLVLILERFEQLNLPLPSIDVAPMLMGPIKTVDDGYIESAISWDYRVR